MTFKEKLRQAARNAKACRRHGGPDNLCDVGCAVMCNDCVDSVIAAVLDEFIRDVNDSVIKAEDYFDRAINNEIAEMIFHFQRTAVEE